MIDDEVDLAAYIKNKYGRWLPLARAYAKRMRNEDQTTPINYDVVMHWLRVRRKDLYGVILNHPKGELWLRHQIPLVKELLGL